LVKTIDELQREGDIAPNSDAYHEISHVLSGLGLNRAFFVFTRADNSLAARKVEDGRSVAFPVLTVYLKYDDDFRQTGIDRRLGNWDDGWALTVPVRKALIGVLERHQDLRAEVSDRTFVFVDTRERVAFLRLGKDCKQAVRDLILREAPGVEVSRIFWTEARQYHAIMKDKLDYKRVKRDVKAKVGKALPALLAKADVNAYCRNYNATIEFGFHGLNPFNLIREDL
jgi:hypothetical protein